jgi:O-antigen ligase
MRQLAGLGIACLGAAGSLVGFAGLIWRWFPLAMPAQGLWRLSTTLTYSDAAGLALGMCLLVALGVERHPALARVAVCLCGAGMVATQSRGACLAVACACALVPWKRYVRVVLPLLAGFVLGVVAIATSPDANTVPWLGPFLIVAIGISALPVSSLPGLALDPRFRTLAVCLLLAGVLASVILLRHEIGLRTLAPSNHDRSTEWSVAWHQWGTAPVFGVGPDRILLFHTVDGTYARFVHNEYLQVAADSGAVGLALLLAALVAIIRAVRRVDVLSSCACAALVCCAIGGAFDFDWHLPFVGFLAGSCAGLAARVEPAAGGKLRRSEVV